MLSMTGISPDVKLQLLLDMLADQCMDRGNDADAIVLNHDSHIIVWQRNDQPPMHHPIELGTATTKEGLKLRFVSTRQGLEETIRRYFKTNNKGIVICDECSVSGVSEHRCHRDNAIVAGERTFKPCQCPECIVVWADI